VSFKGGGLKRTHYMWEVLWYVMAGSQMCLPEVMLLNYLVFSLTFLYVGAHLSVNRDGCLVPCSLRQFLTIHRRIPSVYWCTSLSLHLLYVTKVPNLKVCPGSSRPDRKIWLLTSCLQKNAAVTFLKQRSSSHYHVDTHYFMSLGMKLVNSS
jgi:hypothetical protein